MLGTKVNKSKQPNNKINNKISNDSNTTVNATTNATTNATNATTGSNTTVRVPSNPISRKSLTTPGSISNLAKNTISSVVNNNNPMKPKSYITNKNGFPEPKKCNGLASLIDGKCLETENPLKIIDATHNATTNVTNAALHFAITTGAVGLNKVLDIVSFAILGLDNMNMENKEEIMKKLEEKTVLLQYLANDKKSKALVNKLFSSLAVLIMDGTEVAKEPLIRAMNNITTTTVSGINNVMKNGSKFIKNAIKIIPGIGDAYIILDNALAIGIAGSRIGATMAKNADEITSTGNEILGRLKNELGPNIQELENNMDELNKIREDLTNIDMTKIVQNIESKVGKSIENTGKIAANTINNVTPKLVGGKTKSSIKRKKRMNGKSKKVRFNI